MPGSSWSRMRSMSLRETSSGGLTVSRGDSGSFCGLASTSPGRIGVNPLCSARASKRAMMDWGGEGQDRELVDRDVGRAAAVVPLVEVSVRVSAVGDDLLPVAEDLALKWEPECVFVADRAELRERGVCACQDGEFRRKTGADRGRWEEIVEIPPHCIADLWVEGIDVDRRCGAGGDPDVGGGGPGRNILGGGGEVLPPGGGGAFVVGGDLD